MAKIPKFLNVLFKQAIAPIMDSIAKDGVIAIRSALEKSGFIESEYLKNYQVLAHVSSKDIIFEILIDSDAIDKESIEKMKEENEDNDKEAEENKKKPKRVYKTISVDKSGNSEIVSKKHDARNRVTDSANQLKDARKNSQNRKDEHELAAHAPRNMSINKDGKLSIKLKKEVTETKDGGVIMPQDDFEGVSKEIVEAIKQAMSKNVVVAMKEVIAEAVNT